ncbi:MAG: ABC-2 family transporter protein [Candidatus Micrarchaeaceae archaeon]
MENFIARNTRMYFASQKYKMLAFFTYRIQAVVWLAVFVLSGFYQVIMVTIIYSVSSGISGWTYYQILALGGLANIFISLAFFTISPQVLGRSMRNGQLDQKLTKPYNPVLIALSTTGEVSFLGSAITGAAVFAYAVTEAHIPLLSLAPLIAIFALGTADVVLFILMLTLISYVLFKGASFVMWLVDIGKNASSYPLTIYGLVGLLLLTIGMPVGLATFLPAETLFGRLSPYQFGAAILFEAIALYAYYKASAWLLTKYSSGGG